MYSTWKGSRRTYLHRLSISSWSGEQSKFACFFPLGNRRCVCTFENKRWLSTHDSPRLTRSCCWLCCDADLGGRPAANEHSRKRFCRTPFTHDSVRLLCYSQPDSRPRRSYNSGDGRGRWCEVCSYVNRKSSHRMTGEGSTGFSPLFGPGGQKRSYIRRASPKAAMRL